MSNDEPGAGDDQGQEPEKPDRGQNPFAGTPFEGLWPSGQGAVPGGGMPGMPGGPGVPGGSGGQSGGPGDPAAFLEQLRLQMQAMLAEDPSSGPINWTLAADMAKSTIMQAGDASLTAGERGEIADAVRLAEHWLDDATTLPSSSAEAVAWSRIDWLEGTLPSWQKLVDPLAGHIVDAMSNVLPNEVQSLAGPFGELMNRAGGMMFGVQVGQALGQLATEVIGATDIGLPLGTAGQPALLPANVAAFGEGLDLPLTDVRLYLALRECAHQRLIHHAPWLSSHLTSLVEEYARGLHVDISKFESRMEGVDLSDPEAVQAALGSGLLEPEQTPRQKAALVRLETALALVEGWVDDVVTEAAAPRLPSAVRLREAVRRRRAEGGPAEQTFATLVGLELRPRRLREAATLWAALREGRGSEGRDALWRHPDLLPSADDLDDPLGFVERSDEAETFDLGDFEKLSGAQPSGSPDTDSPEPGSPESGSPESGSPESDSPDSGTERPDDRSQDGSGEGSGDGSGEGSGDGAGEGPGDGSGPDGSRP